MTGNEAGADGAPEGWTLLAAMAAATTRLRLGLLVTGMPYRHPALLAKQAATVDHLSNGRVNVGVGAGWMSEEFAAASASPIFPKRHKHVRETIEIMQGIWTNDLFEYHGEFADFDRCGFGWKTLQPPNFSAIQSLRLDDLPHYQSACGVLPPFNACTGGITRSQLSLPA